MNHTSPTPEPAITTFGDIADYIGSLEQSGHWAQITSTEETFIPWLEKVFAFKKSAFLIDSDIRLLDAIIALSPSSPHVFHILVTSRTHLDYLDALATAGLSWDIDYENIELWSWLENHNRDLSALVTIPEAYSALTKSLTYKLSAYYDDSYKSTIPQLLSSPITKQLLVNTLSRLAEKHTNVIGSWSAWEGFLERFSHLNCPEIRTLNPHAIDTLFTFDPVEELAERIRRGTLVEYTWPEYENLMATIDSSEVSFTERFPYIGVVHGTTLTLLSGEETKTYTIPNHYKIRHAIPVGDDLYLHFDEDEIPENPSYWWASTNTTTQISEPGFILEVTGRNSYTLNSKTYLGNTELIPGMKLLDEPVGQIFGQHQLYCRRFFDEKFVVFHQGFAPHPQIQEDFNERLRAGTLPGVTIYPEELKDVPEELTLSFWSFIHPVTPATKDSPLGSKDGWHYCYRFEGDIDVKQFVISPVASLPIWESVHTPVKRPGGGAWLIAFQGGGVFDAATYTWITNSHTSSGRTHPLSKLPLTGYHHLKVRNQEVSERMRGCTREQAKELLDNPTEILTFADYDEVLAAAIAGIIADIASIKEFGVELPALDQVPGYLEYLYSS